MSNRIDAIIDALEEVECAAREVMRDLDHAVEYGHSSLDADKTEALNAALDKLDRARSDEGVRVSKERELDERAFWLDGERIELDEFLSVNSELSEEEKQAVRNMKPGQTIRFGGGAAAEWLLVCEPEAEPMTDDDRSNGPGKKGGDS